MRRPVKTVEITWSRLLSLQQLGKTCKQIARELGATTEAVEQALALGGPGVNPPRELTRRRILVSELRNYKLFK